MAAHRTIFWDVDTQYDFMNPDGRLYVPGAEEIIENVSKVRRFAFENGFSMIASVDWHMPQDPEISLDPDFRTTWPPHCMANTPGAERVGYLGDVPIRHVPLDMVTVRQLAELFMNDPFHVVIRTNSVEVFWNPNTQAILEIVRPTKVLVFGVALDVCVKNTVAGLLKWGKCEVFLLKNAVKSLNLIPDAQLLQQFAENGVILTDSDHLEQICAGF